MSKFKPSIAQKLGSNKNTNMDDKRIAEQATREARARKKQFARIQVDAFASEPRPVSVFMVGSPIAAKAKSTLM